MRTFRDVYVHALRVLSVDVGSGPPTTAENFYMHMRMVDRYVMSFWNKKWYVPLPPFEISRSAHEVAYTRKYSEGTSLDGGSYIRKDVGCFCQTPTKCEIQFGQRRVPRRATVSPYSTS